MAQFEQLSPVLRVRSRTGQRKNKENDEVSSSSVLTIDSHYIIQIRHYCVLCTLVHFPTQCCASLQLFARRHNKVASDRLPWITYVCGNACWCFGEVVIEMFYLWKFNNFIGCRNTSTNRSSQIKSVREPSEVVLKFPWARIIENTEIPNVCACEQARNSYHEAQVLLRTVRCFCTMVKNLRMIVINFGSLDWGFVQSSQIIALTEVGT